MECGKWLTILLYKNLFSLITFFQYFQSYLPFKQESVRQRMCNENGVEVAEEEKVYMDNSPLF